MLPRRRLPGTAVLGSRLLPLSGERAARASAPGPAPCLPASSVAPAASAPTSGGGLESGPQTRTPGGQLRRGSARTRRASDVAGRPVTRRARTALCFLRGKGGRGPRMMGPAEEDAERAGGSDTSLPGRRALQPPFPEGTAVRRPGLCRGARAPGLLGP